MRLRYNPNAEKNLKNSKYLIQKFPFTLKKDMVIELGMGKGHMITQLANKNKNKVFIGVEKYETVAEKSLTKASSLELDNFKIICKDIKDINDFLKGQVELMWLTFSDPWPKKRHAQRRLTHVNFLKKYQQILTLNGIIKFKTDNDQFFAWTLEHLKEQNFKVQNQTNDLHKSFLNGDNVMTEYEKKWQKLGKNINYLEILINN